MRGLLRWTALGMAAWMFAVACSKVPYTNRRQFRLVPKGIMNDLGKSSYAQMLGQVNVQRSGQNAEILRKVGGDISRVADEPDFDWSYAMIDDPTMNAWCLPGGYIGFYSGILPVLESEAGMSFVMGHEVGHAIAHHSAERLSQRLALVGGLTALDIFISGRGKMSGEQRTLIMAALGLGAEVGMSLPFSRAHERESDVIGLMLMAEAGYPPATSIGVWDRMESRSGGGGPAFLSTHPAYEARRQNQKEWMPVAAKKYQRNKLARDTREAIWRP